MTSWLIIRTDRAKELYVCRQIALAGYDAWCPMEVRMVRPGIARRVSAMSHVRREVHMPVLPKMLFAAVPVAAEADIARIRHLEHIERDGQSVALRVAGNEVLRFKAEIDRLNEATRALNAISTRKTKQVWRNMRDALMEITARAGQTVEQAA